MAAATGPSLAATRAAKQRPCCAASWLPASRPESSRSPGSKTCSHASALIRSTASPNSSLTTGRPTKFNSRLDHLIEAAAPVILSRLRRWRSRASRRWRTDSGWTEVARNLIDAEQGILTGKRYPKFRKQHLFVGSGVIEAGRITWPDNAVTTPATPPAIDGLPAEKVVIAIERASLRWSCLSVARRGTPPPRPCPCPAWKPRFQTHTKLPVNAIRSAQCSEAKGRRF